MRSPELILSRLTTGRTASYKFLVVAATVICTSSCILLIVFWKGNTNIWESLYITPSGFGTGLLFTSTFVGLAAAVDGSQMATATAVYFLSGNIGAIVGASFAATALETTLRSQLPKSLQGIPGGGQVRLPNFSRFEAINGTKVLGTDSFLGADSQTSVIRSGICQILDGSDSRSCREGICARF